MDQTTLNIAAAAVMACLGWFARMLWDRQEAQSKALADVRILIAGEYVSNLKFSQIMGELRDDMRYIRERLDEIPQRRQGDQG
jgi:hypothetical protein